MHSRLRVNNFSTFHCSPIELLSQQLVKVTWHKTASPQQMDGTIVFTKWRRSRQCALPFHVGTLAPPDEYDSTCASFGPIESTTQTANDRLSRFGRPFVKLCALCYRTVVLSVCLSVLSVSDVGVLWPNGWTDQDETWHTGRPRPWPHCVTCGPCSSPSPKGLSPQFSVHICCRKMAVWIKMPLVGR